MPISSHGFLYTAVVLVLAGCPQLGYADEHTIGVQDVHRYLRTVGVVSTGTDALLDGALAKPATDGVSWLKTFELLVAIDAIADDLQRKDYTAAILNATEYGTDKMINGATWSALSGAVAIAKLASLPVQLALENFAAAVTNRALAWQIRLYVEARQKESSQFFLIGKDDDRYGITFTDEGWLLTVGDNGGTSYGGTFPPSGYTKEKVFGLAEQVWQSSQKIDEYKRQRTLTLDEFKKVLTSAESPTQTASTPATSSTSSLTTYYVALRARDFIKAYSIAIDLALRDDAAGAYALGLMYANGRGTMRNMSQAGTWFEKSAKAGYAPGQVMYAAYLHDVTKDDKTAVDWLKKAVAQSDGVGSAVLAAFYQQGIGLPADANQAEQLLRNAVDPMRRDAEMGRAEAQEALASLLESGEAGVQKDVQGALIWLRRAAEQNLLSSQYSLGYHYESGVGVQQNFIQAVAWYSAAASPGFPQAQIALGILYMNGKGVPRNDNAALEWFSKAAEQGYALGEVYLAYMYETGRGTAKDITNARIWYEKAAAQGENYAISRLKVLGRTSRFNCANLQKPSQSTQVESENLSDGEAKVVAERHMNSQGYLIQLGQVKVPNWTKEASEDEKGWISVRAYEDYKIFQNMGLIRITSQGGPVANQPFSWNNWMNMSQGGLGEEINVQATGGCTSNIPGKLFVRFGEFRVPEIIKNEPQQKQGVDQLRVLMGIYEAKWTSEWAEFESAKGQRLDSQKKFIMLLKYDFFSKRWNAIASDYAALSEGFSTQNVVQMLSALPNK